MNKKREEQRKIIEQAARKHVEEQRKKREEELRSDGRASKEDEQRKIDERLERERQERLKEEEAKKEAARIAELKQRREKEEELRSLTGALWKRGDKFLKVWREKYVTLQGDECLVFKDKQASKPESRISLKGCSVMPVGNMEGKEHCFMVKTSEGKFHVFSAQSIREADDWMDAMELIAGLQIDVLARYSVVVDPKDVESLTTD